MQFYHSSLYCQWNSLEQYSEVHDPKHSVSAYDYELNRMKSWAHIIEWIFSVKKRIIYSGCRRNLWIRHAAHSDIGLNYSMQMRVSSSHSWTKSKSSSCISVFRMEDLTINKRQSFYQQHFPNCRSFFCFQKLSLPPWKESAQYQSSPPGEQLRASSTKTAIIAPNQNFSIQKTRRIKYQESETSSHEQ